jgi:hypothetical protein
MYLHYLNMIYLRLKVSLGPYSVGEVDTDIGMDVSLVVMTSSSIHSIAGKLAERYLLTP